MPITEKQRDNRKHYIGSSDAPAIVGVDPWRSAADVFYEKTGKLESFEPDENQAMKVGRYCEGAILDWFADEKQVKLVRNQFRVHENKIMAAHLDAVVQDKPEWIVEVKSTGLTTGRPGLDWGEAGTDEVPERVSIQCQHQMAILAQVEVVWVPALMVGSGFTLYRVERNNALIKDLIEIEETFWHDNVLRRKAPDGILPSFDTVKNLRRIPNRTVKLNDELVLNYLQTQEAEKAATKDKEVAKLRLIASLEDAEAGTWTNGVVNYFMVHRKPYTVQEGSFRKLTFKTKKETPDVK